VHLAYLHFYLAMSHDTMAREATWKHRAAELDQAEQHYLAALEAINTPDPRELVDVPERSPHSPASDDDAVPNGRRTSDASQHSIASSATSVADSDTETTPRKASSPSFLKARALFETSPARPSTPPKFQSRAPSKPSKLTIKKRPIPIVAPNAAQAYHEEQFSSDLSAFTTMIKTHLANVLALKETTPAPSAAARFPVTRSRSSTVSSSWSDSRGEASEREEERPRRARRTLSVRPRFDPQSVRALCSEALSEL